MRDVKYLCIALTEVRSDALTVRDERFLADASGNDEDGDGDEEGGYVEDAGQ